MWSYLDKAIQSGIFLCSHLLRIPSSCLQCYDEVLPTIKLFTQISYEDIHNALTALDPSKGTGIDSIGPTLLKYCASALTPPLHYLFYLVSDILYHTYTN